MTLHGIGLLGGGKEGDHCDRLINRGGWWEDHLLQRCTFPIGPRNCYSNIAYPLAGVALVMLDSRPTTWVLAAALTLLGFGSFYYHGAKTDGGFLRNANGWDWAGMWSTMGTLAVLAWAPRAPWQAAAFVGFFAFWVGLVFSFKRTKAGKSRRFDWHMGLLFLVAATPAFLYGNRWLAALSVALFALGFAAWQCDKRRIPIPLFGKKWGHAIWHILGGPAVATLCLACLR